MSEEEKNAIKEKIERLKKLRSAVNSVNSATLPSLKRKAEEIYNGLTENYTGGNEKVFRSVGSINGDIVHIQTVASNLISAIDNEIRKEERNL